MTGFALMAAGVIVASQHPIPWLRRVLTWQPLRLAGKYSYGMYVYHLLIYLALYHVAKSLSPATGGELPTFVALAYAAVSVLVVTGVSALSFHVLEQPLLRLKRYFPSPAAPLPLLSAEPPSSGPSSPTDPPQLATVRS